MNEDDDLNKPMALPSEIAWQKRQQAIRDAKDRCARRYRDAERMLDLEIQSADAAHAAALDRINAEINARWASQREAA